MARISLQQGCADMNHERRDGTAGQRRDFIRKAGGMAAIALSPAWLTACATARRFEMDGTPLAALMQGDEWAYDELNGYNREQQAEVRYVVQGLTPTSLRIEVDGKPLSALRGGQVETYAQAWAVERDTVYDQDNRYEPPLPVLPTLLEPGVRQFWESRVTTGPKEPAKRWHVQLDVFPEERVQVPAGEFEALRIRRLIKFEHPDFFRTQSERTENLWYVPEVKRWVKREWRGQYMPKLRSRHPMLREDWIVWELKRWTAG